MKQDGVETVRSMIASILESKLLESGIALVDLDDDLDLRREGLVDSLGFVRLIVELEARLGSAVDLADLAPEQLTTVGPLARYLSARHLSS